MNEIPYEKKIANYLKSPVNRANTLRIFNMITSQYKRNTEVGNLREKARNDDSKLFPAIQGLQEKILRDGEYSASVIPTVISSDEARNLLFSNETKPTKESVYYWLYHILTGFASGYSVVNLANLDENAKEDFRNDLIQRKGIFGGRVERTVLQEVTGRLPFTEYAFAFELLNYFVFWFHNKQLAERSDDVVNLRKMGVRDEDIPERIGVREDTALVVYAIPQGKKRRAEFIPRTKSFITRWYSDFLASPTTQQPPLGRFLSSLYASGSKESTSVMNKFLLYLLRDEVDGMLLEKLLSMKINALPRIAKLPYAKFFFSRLA